MINKSLLRGLFAVFMMQGPGQREYIRSLLRGLVYAAVE